VARSLTLGTKGQPRRRGFSALALALFFATLFAGASACTTTRFLSQAAVGQWDLYRRARPLAEVAADSKTAPHTRELLREVFRIKSFGQRQGLSMHENYEDFVALDRPFVVWFVNASDPLAFEPNTFWFPVVGSFPGLSWFREADARAFAHVLVDQGWDVNVRGVSAYSTGGWFDDPILSTMLPEERPEAVGLLANLLLHESLHATVLLENQQYFNESLASFVADQLTPLYLRERFGEHSQELLSYVKLRREKEQATDLLLRAYFELSELYESDSNEAHKRREKARIFAAIERAIPFESPPNNATLIGFALYHEGKAEMARLRRTCPSWPDFLTAVSSADARHFAGPQSPEIGPVFELLAEAECRPFHKPLRRSFGKQLRQREQRLPVTRSQRSSSASPPAPNGRNVSASRG
jgi:predicted aminopeptidase